ncbi:MAG: hypothetical protein ACLGIA_06760 [Actinomycetes bacterium]
MSEPADRRSADRQPQTFEPASESFAPDHVVPPAEPVAWGWQQQPDPHQQVAPPNIVPGQRLVQPQGAYPVPQPAPRPYDMAGAQQAAAIAVLGRKSAGLAAVLSLLLVGAGQMYCGRVGRGFAFLAAYIVSWLLMAVFIGFLLVPAILIWALVDAISLANRHNALLAHRLGLTAPGPWS